MAFQRSNAPRLNSAIFCEGKRGKETRLTVEEARVFTALELGLLIPFVVYLKQGRFLRPDQSVCHLEVEVRLCPGIVELRRRALAAVDRE
ncbi:hypothetical protein RRF57_009911 [Xylaria bambusicola]|uniref:Uncharacterized protein n=1 Tax=Xylaria bambusicola TaxID=326684 RepID=A0AAN7URN3_9PEZI